MGDSIPTSPLLTITKLIHIREPQNNSYSLAWHNLKLLTKFLTFIPQAPKSPKKLWKQLHIKGLVLEDGKYACGEVHVPMQCSAEVRGQHQEPSSIYWAPPYYVVRQGFSGLGELVAISTGKLKGILSVFSTVSPHPHCWDYRHVQTRDPAF